MKRLLLILVLSLFLTGCWSCPKKNFMYWSPQKGPVLIEIDKLKGKYYSTYWIYWDEWLEKMKKLREWEREYEEKYGVEKEYS